MPPLSASPTPSQRSYALVLLTLLSALAFMDRQILAVLLQPVKAEFGLTDLQVGLITGLGFSLTFVLLGIPLGKHADRGQRRTVLVWSRGVGALLGAAGAMAAGFWSLLASRAGSALSDAGGAPASVSMLSDLYPPEKRSRVISVLGTGASVGSLLALVLGSWLAQQFGWRVTMAVIGGSALLCTLVLRFSVAEPARTHHAAAGASAQRRGATRELWRNPVTRWLILGSAFTLLAGYGFGAWNNALLIRRHGLSLQDAGWVSGAAALASILGALWSGNLTDRLCHRDQRWQLGVPLLGVALALPSGLLYLAMPAGAVWAATALLVAYAFFVVWWAAPVYAALSFVVPPHRRATAHATIMLVGSVVGSGLGPIVTGWLSDRLDTGLPGDGLRFALMAMVGMLLPGWLAFSRALPAYPQARNAMAEQCSKPAAPQTH
ncbi:MFS transporter [Alicycliphilus denitrificans]|uniref:MFS transporter n=1 Tax=Alicycliphilus denitrificans TaxID=179636 RepID=UPI00384B6FE0